MRAQLLAPASYPAGRGGNSGGTVTSLFIPPCASNLFNLGPWAGWGLFKRPLAFKLPHRQWHPTWHPARLPPSVPGFQPSCLGASEYGDSPTGLFEEL